ncbi:MauE/DoxX family redox-associated membrane protein [Granulosicoccus sp. 3-233]|uniref:MauE/DoxX family redox-associated membrane protein n=1 Tax=Granulosicoccus sp. 3-233 TaxID=3417969 RepID=UPI003D3535F6
MNTVDGVVMDTKNRKSTKARLYRMDTGEHTCPFGLKALDLLERQGYTVEDHRLENREQTDEFMATHGVSTTPQVFIGEDRIGGYEDLREYLDKPVADPEGTSYKPVIAVFSVAFLMAAAADWQSDGELQLVRTVEWFIAFSMCILAILKLQDIEKFSTMFLGYDLLARKVVRYSYVYPFAEALAGVLMIAGVFLWLAIPIALFIGSIGAASVIKAVYIDKRELECACVGGSASVPLGFVSLTENLMMIAMAIWMWVG